MADVIGQSLIESAELPVQVILTDQLDMLPLALLCREQVLHVEPLSAESAGIVASAAIDDVRRGLTFEFAGCRVTAAPTATLDAAALQSVISPLAANVFLAEPFERIRAALTEAQLVSHDAAEYPQDRAAA
jgi:hypothetical protein